MKFELKYLSIYRMNYMPPNIIYQYYPIDYPFKISVYSACTVNQKLRPMQVLGVEGIKAGCAKVPILGLKQNIVPVPV